MNGEGPSPDRGWLVAGHKALIGNIALDALPGSRHDQGNGIEPIIAKALEDARLLADAGFDAVLLQNSSDGSFSRDGGPETIAYLTAIGTAIRREVRCGLGINILTVGASSSLAVADAVGADFVRIKIYVGAVVTHHGIVEGGAGEALAFRERLAAHDVRIVADVHDRSTWVVGEVPLAEAARAALDPGGAEALVITGRSQEESLARVREVRGAIPDALIWCGGGATAEDLPRFLEAYDAIIVAQSIKIGGDYAARFDRDRARRFIDIAGGGGGRHSGPPTGRANP